MVVEFAGANIPVSETAGVVMVWIIKPLEVATPLDVDMQAMDLSASGRYKELYWSPYMFIPSLTPQNKS